MQVEYTILDTNNEYIRNGRCAVEDLANQTLEGQVLLEGYFTPSEYYFENGQALTKGTSPTPLHRWDEIAKNWIEDKDVTLNKLKKAIDTIRDNLEFSDISYNNYVLQANRDSINKLNGKLGAISDAEANGVVDIGVLFWIDKENNIITFNSIPEFKTWLQGFRLAINTRTNNLYYNARLHKNNLTTIFNNTSKSLTDLLTYNFNIGWN
jgi:hypothetical protein